MQKVIAKGLVPFEISRSSQSMFSADFSADQLSYRLLWWSGVGGQLLSYWWSILHEFFRRILSRSFRDFPFQIQATQDPSTNYRKGTLWQTASFILCS